MKKYPVILDVDTGIDDAVAIAMACYSKNLDVQLITTVFGNVEIKKVIKNTLVVLDDIKKINIPVAIGEVEPIKKIDFEVSAHGKNGLGNYTHTIKQKPIRKNYLKAMYDIIAKNELTYIIACGPLTNIAKFIVSYPELNSKIHLILVTGLLDIDKMHPYLNFNIQKDIEACKICLERYKKITIVPSDMGHRAYIPQKDFYKTAKCGEVGQIFANMYPYHLDRTVKDGAAMHDMCGVFALSNPNCFTTTTCRTKLVSNKNGSYLDFDYNAKNHNCTITTDINIKKIHKLYYKIFKNIK